MKAERGVYQLYKIVCHAPIVLIDRVHNCINEGLLVSLTQLRNIAKVHISNPSVAQREDVAWMWITVEEPELQQVQS